jgi:nitronate monooxygenase
MNPTPLCDLLGMRYPILQAPTGSIAGYELASAVSRAGGLGSMGVTWLSEEAVLEALQALKAETDAPFFLNYALAFEPKTLPRVLEEGIPILTFSWGDPTPLLPLVRRAGVKVGVQVTNVLGAKKMIEAGADFLICQGREAGGHVQSHRVLWELLPEIVAVAGGTPVVAAGGIGDGKGIAQAFALGAQGAMLGTRFVATHESRAHAEYKSRLCETRAEDTALTVCFEGGWGYAAHRIIRNSTLESWEAAGSPAMGQRPGEGDTLGYTASGEPIFRYEDVAPRVGMNGEIEAMCLYAGESCSVIEAVLSAEECLQQLVREYDHAMQTCFVRG